MFCLLLLPLTLLLVAAMMETYCASAAIIFHSAVILLEILALDPLGVALAWVSSAKAIRSLAVAVDRYANDSAVLVWYTGSGM